MSERIETTEAETTQALMALGKDIDKQRADVTELVDTKFEFINKNLYSQLGTVISTYEDLGGKLKQTHNELVVNFKEKVVNIKSMVATFFAKIDK